MGDIHLLGGTFRKNGSGTLGVLFHVPNTDAGHKGGNVSELPGIQQVEADKLANGTLIEAKRYVKINKKTGTAIIKAKIRSMWQVVAAEEQGKVTDKYKLNGITLARAV